MSKYLAALLAGIGCLSGLHVGDACGAEHRVPWNTSRVVGSPEPPPPYVVRRTFAKLDVDQPIGVVHEPGTQNLLVVHQLWPWVGPGRILRVVDDGRGDDAEVLLSLDRTIYGVAPHPDFKRNGFLFVGSNGPATAEDKDIPGRRFRAGAAKTTRVSRFTVGRRQPFACDPASEKVIVQWPSNGHNGGDLAFGADRMLYVTAGDGTSDSDVDLAGQDLSRLLAKVLRIDVNRPLDGKAYAIPKDNPFLGVAGARGETWAYGFRNPWRLHVDRRRGDVWIGNNGQDLWEQIYLVTRGANYGWSLYEGSHPFYPNRRQGPTPISRPIAEHHHSEARSLTGGVVYYGRSLPALRGAYLYGDWSTGKIWGLRHQKGRRVWHQELADTSLSVSGFGIDSRGELLVIDYGGGLYRLEPAPPRPNPATPFPTRLSQTGLFMSVAEHQPHPGLVPYTVNAPLWSDGALKQRWIGLPGLAQIDFRPRRGWEFPDGTVLVKTFSLETESGNPRSRRRVETRLLTRQQGEWQGYSYRWNDAQTNAELVSAAGADVAFEIRDASAPQGRRRQSWHYPSRAECMVCHSRAANFVLGLNVLQMNREFEVGGQRENQLRRLERLGMFRVHLFDHLPVYKKSLAELADVTADGPFAAALGALVPDQAAGEVRQWINETFAELEDLLRSRPAGMETARLPLRPAEYARLVDPSDASESVSARARSYLHANCAACHVTAGGGNAFIDLEFGTPVDKMRVVDVPPSQSDLGLADARLVAPKSPDRSTLLHRVLRRGRGQMPPLATTEVDTAAAELLRAWIQALEPPGE